MQLGKGDEYADHSLVARSAARGSRAVDARARDLTELRRQISAIDAALPNGPRVELYGERTAAWSRNTCSEGYVLDGINGKAKWQNR
jgi:hypothetical protein